MLHEDRSARSAYRVAHSKAPGPGITERASDRPGKAPEAGNRRNLTAASVRERPLPAKRDPDPRIVSCGPEHDEVSSEWNEKQPPGIVSSSSYKQRHSIDEFRSPELALFALANECGMK